jgi:D-tyrosyl-tRNA(Tyr) deacylase
MIIVFQRVERASVTIDEEITARIGCGGVILLGIERGDTHADVSALVLKIIGLRVFSGARPMDRGIIDTGGSLLVVSQFTLAARVDKGRRPSMELAEKPERAEPLYVRFIDEVRAQNVPVESGRFGADMKVSLVNDGPVTLLLRARDGAVRCV